MEWLQTIITICTLIIAAWTIVKNISNWKENQGKESKFMMKMLFEIIDILDGKEINGQVKELRKEAEKFNIDN